MVIVRHGFFMILTITSIINSVNCTFENYSWEQHTNKCYCLPLVGFSPNAGHGAMWIYVYLCSAAVLIQFIHANIPDGNARANLKHFALAVWVCPGINSPICKTPYYDEKPSTSQSPHYMSSFLCHSKWQIYPFIPKGGGGHILGVHGTTWSHSIMTNTSSVTMASIFTQTHELRQQHG